MQMTAPAAQMDEVVRQVAPLLRAHRFKKQRHAFARDSDAGAVQALLFQMGRFEPSEERRPGLYGAFTVELGIWFADIARLSGETPPKFVRPYDCHLRQRLGFLLGEQDDTWWSLDEPATLIAEAMSEAFEEIALPWLDRLSTPQALLDALAADDPTVKDWYMPTTVRAALHYINGDRQAATDVVRRDVAGTQHRGAAERLVSWAQQIGLDVSMDDAKVMNMLERERAEWAAREA